MDKINRTDSQGPGTLRGEVARTFASFYDFYDGPGPRQDELAMYRSLAAEAGGPVLELACGTGIITLDLARAGHEVTGLDVSPDMLDVARAKLREEPAEVRGRILLVEANMRDFQLDRAFAFAFIPNNSFGYLIEQADRQSCLRCLHKHIEPGGVLLIAEQVYAQERLAKMRSELSAIKEWAAGVNPATGLFTSFRSVTGPVDAAGQLVYTRNYIDEIQSDGTVKRYCKPERADRRRQPWECGHCFTQPELRSLIEKAGFVIADLWDGPDRTPFGPGSRNMIFVACKERQSPDDDRVPTG